ncbi:nucleotidyltransferase family protein [candidate division KSB1 bacterium]|nr:nucleotidyltransferase family protein [candidate division KSB1 bacterium]NIR73124.1 nucleotidyltransferase family protein [candidate division KSB1 bacterium]NIS27859.1 nucleotidyltransferase family protein [candidate division KSB1 bacterium]NIT74742.1 nucleotidyltransferase family protein [candidate division KSB1 bacterium]NIU28524.1 nucleotidyltransferase family protein [candidate division KSB1 bacterium]
MRNLEEIREVLSRHSTDLEQKYKVERMAVLGSYVRGDQDKDSDLDILVKFREPIGFLFIHLADFLEELLDVKVDLVTEDGIKSNRWEYIKEELTYV